MKNRNLRDIHFYLLRVRFDNKGIVIPFNQSKLTREDFDFITDRLSHYVETDGIDTTSYNLGLFRELSNLTKREDQEELINRLLTLRELFTNSIELDKGYYISDSRLNYPGKFAYSGLCELNRTLTSKTCRRIVEGCVGMLLLSKTSEINAKKGRYATFWVIPEEPDAKDLRLKYLDELIEDIKLVLNYEE